MRIEDRTERKETEKKKRKKKIETGRRLERDIYEGARTAYHNAGDYTCIVRHFGCFLVAFIRSKRLAFNIETGPAVPRTDLQATTYLNGRHNPRVVDGICYGLLFRFALDVQAISCTPRSDLTG